VVTDRIPAAGARRRQYEASDAQHALELPAAEPLQAAARALDAALASGDAHEVRRTGERVLELLSDFYAVSRPSLSVLGVRPHRVIEGQLSYELFGDYAPATQKIRVWMRTAMRGKLTSYRGLLNTLFHEFCHHLDIRRLGFGDTPHTRGFFHRIDALYHLALATPPERRRPLVWIANGRGWRIDWSKLRAR
jgi:hypothetical protein